MASTAAVLNIMVTAQTGQATAALARVDRQLKGTAASGAASQGALSKLGITGKQVAAGGVAAMAYALYKSVQVGMQFEKQLSSLGSVTGATGGQMKRLEDQARSLGRSTIFSATEVVQAQTELAKGGLKVRDILGGALPAALNLAAAGEMDLAQAANTTVNAMNLFGLSGRDATKVADMMATAATLTTAEVSDFAMALTQGGSAAKQVGYSLNQTMVVLEALAKAGIKNSDAGTSMKTAFLQLVAPTQRQAEAARKLGLEFTNQAGEMKGPIQLADELRDKLGGMTRAQRAATLKILAGTDGFRTLASLYDLGSKRAGEFAKANTKAGTAEEMAAKKTDNLSGDIEKLGGALQDKGIDIYKQIQPALRTATQGMVAFLDAVEVPKLDFTDMITSATNFTGAAQQLGRQLGEKIGQGIRQTVSNVTSGAKNLLGKGASLAVNVGGNAVGQARSIFNRVKGIVGRAISFVLSVPSGALSLARSLWSRVKSTVSRAISFVLSLPGVGSLVSKARSIWDAINDALPDIDINIHIPTPSIPNIKLARGTNSLARDSMALVGEQGPELAHWPGGGWSMLGAKGPHMAAIGKGTTVFTASETRKLLAAGIPGYKKGKKPHAKSQGNRWEAALAAAELTASTTDDIAAIGDLIRYWQRQAKKYSRPVKMAGKRGKAMDWGKLTEARQQIKNYTDQLADLTGQGAAGGGSNSDLANAWKDLATMNALRFAVSQAQYGVLKGGMPPFAGSFASGGIVPGPIGQPQVAVVHGGESILPTSGRMEFVITNWQQGTGYLRSIAGQEVDKAGRSASRGVGRTPGNAGALV